MKKKLFIIMLISSCLLSACGKETKVEQSSTTIVETSNTEEKTNTIIEESIVEIEESIKENIEGENSNDVLSIGQSYEIMNDTGILYLYDNGGIEYAIICDESEIKYFIELANDIFIKPELENAGDVLYEMKKEGYIMASLSLSYQDDLLEIMKKYGYEGTSLDITNIKEEDYNKMLEELKSSLSKEELSIIETGVKELIGDSKAYYLKSFETFDKNNNSLNIHSIEELKEYYNNMILAELNKYKELLEIEKMEELVITNDDTLISNLEEEKVYYYNKRTNVVNDSGKVLKVKIISLEPNEEGKSESININENYYTQVTTSSTKAFGKFGNECFYLWPVESKIELFTFEFIDDENEIKTLLEEESLFEGLSISTIKENEIMNLEDYSIVHILNDFNKTIKIVGNNILEGKVEYILEPNEVIEIWADDLEKVYWTYK